MKRLTNRQTYILAVLLSGGYILHVPGTTVMTPRRLSYPEYDDGYILIGPDREHKCTVDRRTFKKFLGEGALTKKGNRWISVLAQEAGNAEGECR